MISCRRKCTRR